MFGGLIGATHVTSGRKARDVTEVGFASLQDGKATPKPANAGV